MPMVRVSNGGSYTPTISSVVYGNASGVATVSCVKDDLIVVSFTNSVDSITFTGATLIDSKQNVCSYYVARATATSVTITAAQNSRLLVAVFHSE